MRNQTPHQKTNATAFPIVLKNPVISVLLFTDADVFAGTERHIFDLAGALRDGDNEMEIAVACPVPSPLSTRCEQAQIRVLDVPKRGFIDWNAVRILRRQLKNRKIDLIHAHNGRTALAAALAISGARRGKLIATQHFLAPNRTTQSGIKAKLFGIAHGWVGQKIGATVAISDAVRDAMIARGEAPDKIAVVRNGIPDVAQISKNEDRVLDAELKTLGVVDGTFVLCAARLEAEKDIASLIRAMKIVVESKPDARCLIAGEGAQHDELQSLIDESGLSQNVKLLGFRDDVLNLMKSCAVFVLPSLAEPFGLVVVEAMALFKPVVATDVGGPCEIIEPHESGFLVAPSSPHQLAQALLQLLDDADLRAKMGTAARARYEKHFTANRMAHEMAAVYRRV